MNERARREKVARFLADETMAHYIKETLREAFLRGPIPNDTAFLAASRIAIDLLEDGWRDLRRIAAQPAEDPTDRKPISL